MAGFPSFGATVAENRQGVLKRSNNNTSSSCSRASFRLSVRLATKSILDSLQRKHGRKFTALPQKKLFAEKSTCHTSEKKFPLFTTLFFLWDLLKPSDVEPFLCFQPCLPVTNKLGGRTPQSTSRCTFPKEWAVRPRHSRQAVLVTVDSTQNISWCLKRSVREASAKRRLRFAAFSFSSFCVRCQRRFLTNNKANSASASPPIPLFVWFQFCCSLFSNAYYAFHRQSKQYIAWDAPNTTVLLTYKHFLP